MSNKASRIIVLCEDYAHEACIRRFLKKGWSVDNRDIHVPPYPCGAGSGKKFVVDSIAKEVKEFRTRDASASTILLVIHDADEHSVDQVTAKLDAKIMPPRHGNEKIAFVIPRWHIETWLAYLDGQTVDESDKRTYKDEYGEIAKKAKAGKLVDPLADKCRQNTALQNPPPSLVAACGEFDRIRDALRK